MALFDLPRPDFLSQGEKSRLIPSVANTSRECRITDPAKIIDGSINMSEAEVMEQMPETNPPPLAANE